MSCLPAAADFQVLNKPGAVVEIEPKLVPKKQNIVVFHGDSYSLSRHMYPEFENLGKKRSDLVILIVDINTYDSPVAKKYNIKSVPYVKMYDAKGQLTSEGPPAYKACLQMLNQK